MLPQAAEPPAYISDEQLDSIVASLIDRLFAAYESGEPGLNDVFTPAALVAAVADDRLLASLAARERRVLAEHSIAGRIEAETRYMPDGTPVRADLEIIVDIAPGARIVDGTGAVQSQVDERQRVVFDLTAAWDGANGRWQIDDLRSPALGRSAPAPGGTPQLAPPCPWAAEDIPPTRGFDPKVDRPWCDGLGRELTDNYVVFRGEGTAHCGWESAALLFVGPQPGWEIDIWKLYNFVRDPEGVFASDWLAEYEVLPAPPAGAVDTGLTNGNVRLFDVPGEYDRAIYALIGDRVERWPRLREPAGCA